MKSLLRRRPSPALIVASIALFVSLSGVSYGVATGFIDSREIKNNEVRSVDIRNNEIRTKDLRNNEIRGIDIRNSTIQGRDIGVNTITGVDIREDTLQQVPSALLADTATSADSADTVSTLKVIPRTTIAEGAPDVTLATHGSLTMKGSCKDQSGSTRAEVRIATTENNTAVGSTAFQESDLDTNETSVFDATDSPAAGTVAQITDPFASAPSGKGFTGQVVVLVDGSGAGSCGFAGHLALQG